MLTQVILESYSESVVFDLTNADASETLILKSVSGLTPQDVTIFSGDFARDGGYYQGRRTGMRFPVFNFKLNPDYANDIEISDVRERLYRLFYEPGPDNDYLRVTLVDDRKPNRGFVCYGEKWNGEIFSQDTSAAISTVCVDAYLKSTAETLTSPGGWLTIPVTYEGSADTGFEVLIKVVANTDWVTLENNGQTMRLNGTFLTDDLVTIGTVEGNRYIRVNGTDKMALLQSPASWLQLKSAANLIKVYGDVPGDGLAVATYFAHEPSWRGV